MDLRPALLKRKTLVARTITRANAAVSPQLLKDLPENGSVILPALRTIWHAGCRYLRWRDQRIIRTLCDVFVK